MKIKILLLLFMCAICYSQKKEGQHYIDSLLVELPKMKEDSLKVNLLNEIGVIYSGMKPKLAPPYCLNALNISKKINWKEGIGKSYNDLAYCYFIKLDYKTAITNYNLALKNTSKPAILIKIYNNLGVYYKYKSQYDKALYFENKSLSLCENLHENKLKIDVITNIGLLYYKLKDYKKAIFFLEKSINLCKNTNKDLALNWFELGKCYIELNQIKKAGIYFDYSIAAIEKSGKTFNEIIFLGDMADEFFNVKEYDKALKYQNKLNVLIKKLEMSDAMCDGLTGNIYLEKARLTKNTSIQQKYLSLASTNFKKRIIDAKNLGNLDGTFEYYSSLSEVQKLQGNYKDALQSYKTYVKYKDSIFNSDNKETIKNLEDKREIELRDKQIKINQLSLKAKEKQKWLYLAGIGFLITIGGLLFFQIRKQKQTNQKLAILNDNLDKSNGFKNKVLGILNHDLRSPVNNFIHYLQLKKENPELLSLESKIRIENETLSSAENLLSSMENILLWSKNQMKNFEPQFKKTNIESVFDDTRKHFSSIKNIEIVFENPENITLDTDENYLKTIIRNLTGNAIKALDCFVPRNDESQIIIWKSWKINDQIFISITDNAGGVTNEQLNALFDDSEVVGTQSGLGLHLIRDLAKAIDCEINVDSKINEGTTFTLTFT